MNSYGDKCSFDISLKKYYRVKYHDYDGYDGAMFFKAYNMMDVIKHFENSEPYHITEIKEYNEQPRAYQGVWVDPSTITEI